MANENAPVGSKPINPGPELRKLREARGVKMSWVAPQLGVSVSELSLLETGKRNWKTKTVEAYRKVVGV